MMARYRLRALARRSVSDPEKMVLPGIIFCQKGDGAAHVWSLGFGWWDWHVTFLLARLATGDTNVRDSIV